MYWNLEILLYQRPWLDAVFMNSRKADYSFIMHLQKSYSIRFIHEHLLCKDSTDVGINIARSLMGWACALIYLFWTCGSATEIQLILRVQ